MTNDEEIWLWHDAQEAEDRLAELREWEKWDEESDD